MNFVCNPSRPFANVPPDLFKSWYPADRPPPPDDTFEIGLVMAGAVSAGAYTAGVMDFLFEALDAWEAAKVAGTADIPLHKVRLKIMTGASAGGMNAAISAAVARYDFAHVVNHDFGAAPPGHDPAANPFYKAWVRDVRIEDMLATDDLNRQGPLRSVLNCEALDRIAGAVVDWKLAGAGNLSAKRAWLDGHFKVWLTLANLQGVPFEIRMTGATPLSHSMTLHQDMIQFAVPVESPIPAGAAPYDHIVLTPNNSQGDPAWWSLGQAALATGAFPIALEPREIVHQRTDYEYRYAYIDSQGQKANANPWPGVNPPPDCFHFASIDGGTFNNEPFDLAHRYLAGSSGENPRTDKKACRAIVMIDPFSEANKPDFDVSLTIAGVLARLLTAFKDQCRFKPINLALARDDEIYSRFLIAPKRGDVMGDRAIASGRLGGFFGFFHEAYRHHDFMLGRANCQAFLRNWFVLHKDNPRIKNTWPAGALANPAYRSRHWADYYQIIPLVDGLDQPQSYASWPKGYPTGYKDFRDPIKRRLNKLKPKVKDAVENMVVAKKANPLSAIGNGIAKLILGMIISKAFGKVEEMAKKAIDDASNSVNAGP